MMAIGQRQSKMVSRQSGGRVVCHRNTASTHRCCGAALTLDGRLDLHHHQSLDFVDSLCSNNFLGLHLCLQRHDLQSTACSAGGCGRRWQYTLAADPQVTVSWPFAHPGV